MQSVHIEWLSRGSLVEKPAWALRASRILCARLICTCTRELVCSTYPAHLVLKSYPQMLTPVTYLYMLCTSFGGYFIGINLETFNSSLQALFSAHSWCPGYPLWFFWIMDSWLVHFQGKTPGPHLLPSRLFDDSCSWRLWPYLTPCW